MMDRVKGCVTEKCAAHKKKTTYKESDDYCSKCGDKLSYVCKKCYTPLEDTSEKYCVRCLAVRQDRNDNVVKVVGSIGGALLTASTVVLTKGKDIAKIISKLK
ncbi:MAG: hypothetical protein JJE18_08075 [Eubacteriaceae bacterium]|nr:hypothetical protein [Eubacteriaceae bacterium]